MEIPIPAQIVDKHVIIWDAKQGSYVYQLGYFGKPVGIRKPKSPRFDRPLELTLLEAAFLQEKNKISIYAGDSKFLTRDEFLNTCKERFPKFEDFYAVFLDLRNKRYIVRPGLKFGTDFAVYRRGPGIDHAPFLVSIFPKASTIKPIDLVRAGRLATSVRKRYVIATVLSDQQIRYYVFQWNRP
ncbi:MAG: tRNA-intron lyase [Candidatus Heimdallarchaeota archaeon]|nr:MAG: tRNA-intron lyase [Candidatus Heimdallarchaeota archaeon]